MATKPFKEKAIRKPKATPAEDTGDKDEFEDKVNRDGGLLKGDFYDKQLEVKVKIEKNEVEEKYAKDYADIHHKGLKDVKIHQEVVRPTQPEQPLAGRVAALESAMAQLHHFISTNLRPDLSKGALKREPDASSATPEKKGSDK